MSYDQRPNTAAIQLHYERAQFTHFPWRKYCKKYSHQHKQAMHNSTLSSYFLQPRTKYLSHGWRSSIRKNLPFIERSSIPAEKYFKGHTLKFRGFFYTKGKTNSLAWIELLFCCCSLTACVFHFCSTLLPWLTWREANQLMEQRWQIASPSLRTDKEEDRRNITTLSLSSFPQLLSAVCSCL